MWRGGERGTWEWIDGWGWRGGIVFHPSPPAPHRSAPRSSLCLSRVSYLIHSSSALARFFLLCIFRFFFLFTCLSVFFFLPLFLLSLTFLCLSYPNFFSSFHAFKFLFRVLALPSLPPFQSPPFLDFFPLLFLLFYLCFFFSFFLASFPSSFNSSTSPSSTTILFLILLVT